MAVFGVEIAGLAQAVPVAGTDLTLLTIFVGIIAVCVLGITLGLAGVAIALLRVKTKVEKQINDAKRKAQPMIADAKAKVDPIIASVTGVVQDLQPKVKSVSDDVVRLSQLVRNQATDLDSKISQVTLKAQSQVDRVDGIVSSTLNSTANVVSNVEKGIKVPFREIAGLVNGVKAGLDVLFSKERSSVSGYSDSVPGGVEREIHRAADRARADAAERASEGRAAAEHAGYGSSAGLDGQPGEPDAAVKMRIDLAKKG